MSEKKNVPAVILNKFEISGKDGGENSVLHAVRFGDLNADSVNVISGKVSLKVEPEETPKETAEKQRAQEPVGFIKLFKCEEIDGQTTKLSGYIYRQTDEKDEDGNAVTKDENGYAITKKLAYVNLTKADLKHSDFSVNVTRVENAERVAEIKKAMEEAEDDEKEALNEELNNLNALRTSGFASVTKVAKQAGLLDKMKVFNFEPKQEAAPEAPKEALKEEAAPEAPKAAPKGI